MKRSSAASSPSVSPTRNVADSSSRLSRPPSQDASLPPYSAPNPLALGATSIYDPGSAFRDEYFPSLSLQASSRPPSRSRATRRPSSLAGSEDMRPIAGRERLPSIRLRRKSSTSPAPPTPVAFPPANPNVLRNVRRSPDHGLPRLTEEGTRPTMAELDIIEPPLEHTTSLPAPEENMDPLNPQPPSRLNVWRRGRLGKLLLPGSTRQGDSAQDPSGAGAIGACSQEYQNDLVDFLDVVDPEIQALSTLTNVQNSLFIPDLGNLINRRPAYSLSQYVPDSVVAAPAPPLPLLPAPPLPAPPSGLGEAEIDQECQLDRVPTVQRPLTGRNEDEDMPTLERSNTITSQLSESRYAALPHGMKLEGWTDQEKRELDDHVRHMLHSRRSRFKRTMKGFGQYVRRPLGFFVTLYAVLITLFGLAWVLFLIGWIYVGEHQVYAIHIIDSVLVALFAVMGDGLAPFRAVDTYHMAFIVHYSRKIAKAKKKIRAEGARRKQKTEESSREREGMGTGTGKNAPPEGADPVTEAAAKALNPVYPHEGLEGGGGGIGNDSDSIERIAASTSNNTDSKMGKDSNGKGNKTAAHKPDATGAELDLEGQTSQELTRKAMEWQEETCLTPAQLKRLRHHQRKLARSHSFYKPYETFTHNAFPLAFLVAVVVLLDLHSCLQISLGATTWGIDYHTRPAAITTTILCLSIAANSTAALVITLGDRRTRKKEVVDLLKRRELTGDAIRRLEQLEAGYTCTSTSGE
ncbi:hypothetical protein ESCO_006308 [Escovopsis weberi]|uniref:Integral membrane protein n=1 Tax=Escovopsis weberi TaxID=150374 RepID=A0A0M9VUQ2_ESCWE|nr:hypothetical protein ESCO_006308 [Escovopsis weberi]